MKIQHLNMIQEIIIRMADNSFKIKGWVITILAALAALSVDKINKDYLLIGILPIVAFWYLDSFYLRQERLFRKLYEEVAKKNESDIDFLMNTQKHIEGVSSTITIMFSKTLRVFYIGLLVAVYLITQVV